MAAAAGGFVLLFTDQGGSDAIEIALPDTAGVPSQPTTMPMSMKVYVSGEVARPGVYELPGDSRAEDAVAAAGGATAEADLVLINLARRLSDEEQIHVPRKGETPSVPAQPVSAAGSSASGKLNINTATADDLDTLPGIGPSRASAIVDYRSENGPFRTVDDLTSVPNIGERIVDSIRNMVEAR